MTNVKKIVHKLQMDSKNMCLPHNKLYKICLQERNRQYVGSHWIHAMSVLMNDYVVIKNVILA